MIRNRKKYKMLNLQKIKNSIKYLLIIMTIGSFIGSFVGYYNGMISYENNLYFDGNKVLFIDGGIVSYIEIFLKNFKYLIVIWFLGFIYLGIIFIFLLGFIKGFSFGFTTSILFQTYNIDGLKYAIFNYVPQAFIYIPFFIFVSFKALQNIFEKNSTNSNKKLDNYNYYKLFIIIILFSVFISILDIILLKIN